LEAEVTMDTIARIAQEADTMDRIDYERIKSRAEEKGYA